ncbi:MAG: hypothetical protein IKU24_00360, partial [Clostridia bacterium]|nr:hypothetical protein [Clostridia bacterium]
NLISPIRVQTVSWKILLYHASYCEHLAKIAIEKARGNNFSATEEAKKFYHEMGKFEWDIEPYYDHCLACRVVEQMVKRPKGIILV